MALTPQIDNAISNQLRQTQLEIPSKTYKLDLDKTAPLKETYEKTTVEPYTYIGRNIEIANTNTLDNLNILGDTNIESYYSSNMFNTNNLMQGNATTPGYPKNVYLNVKMVNPGDIYSIKCYNSQLRFSVVTSSQPTNVNNTVTDEQSAVNNFEVHNSTTYGYLGVVIQHKFGSSINPGMIKSTDFLIVSGYYPSDIIWQPYREDFNEYTDYLQDIIPTTQNLNILVNNRTYPISLSALKLYKFTDEYYDYIDRINNNWYTIISTIIANIDTNNIVESTESNNTVIAVKLVNQLSDIDTNCSMIYCTKFAYHEYTDQPAGNSIMLHNNDIIITIRKDTLTKYHFGLNISGVKDYLQAINPKIYYRSNNSISTQILDTTLINQLDNIFNINLKMMTTTFIIQNISNTDNQPRLKIQAYQEQLIPFPRALPYYTRFEFEDNNLIVYIQNDSDILFSIENGNLFIESENPSIDNYSIIGYYLIFQASDAENFVVDRINGYVDNTQAVEQAIYHILMTERYAYLIYSENYGIELQQYIGKDLNYIEATIENTLKEALTYDLRVLDVTVNSVHKVDNDKVLINFNAITIYGNLIMEVNIDV